MKFLTTNAPNSRLLFLKFPISNRPNPWDTLVQFDQFIDRQRKLDWANSSIIMHFSKSSTDEQFNSDAYLFGREVVGHMNNELLDGFELQDFNNGASLSCQLEPNQKWEKVWQLEKEIRNSRPELDAPWRLVWNGQKKQEQQYKLGASLHFFYKNRGK